MKVNDLMIGDWIYRPDCYDQVKEIRQNGIIGLDSARGLIPISELEPIPLTPEILERNGFVLKPDGWIRCDCDGIEDQNYIFIQFRKGCDEVRRCEINYVNKAQATYYQIKYVHQLQQAARFCKIEMTYE